MESTDRSAKPGSVGVRQRQGRTERATHEALEVSAPFGSTTKQIGLGLTLPKEARALLADARIAANSAVSVVKKREAGRFLLRGLDSGGALGDVGHFVGYSPVVGVPLEIRHVYDNYVPNQVHALVFAPAFLRTEVFRFRQTYSVSLSFYMLMEQQGTEPTISERVLFRGRNGRVDGQLGSRSGVPAFVDMSGTVRKSQSSFDVPVLAAIEAVACNACTHDHFRDVPAVDLTPMLGAKWMKQLPRLLGAASSVEQSEPVPPLTLAKLTSKGKQN